MLAFSGVHINENQKHQRVYHIGDCHVKLSCVHFISKIDEFLIVGLLNFEEEGSCGIGGGHDHRQNRLISNCHFCKKVVVFLKVL